MKMQRNNTKTCAREPIAKTDKHRKKTVKGKYSNVFKQLKLHIYLYCLSWRSVSGVSLEWCVFTPNEIFPIWN